MLRTAIEDALIVWILTRTGMAETQVYIADQNAPIPKTGKYITVRLGDIDRKGRDQVGPTDDTGVRAVIGNREVVATLNGFRKGAEAVLESLADSLDEESGRGQLRAAGIAVWDIGKVLNVTLPEENTMQPHYALEIFLRVAAERTEDISFIRQAVLEATTQSANSADRVENVTIGNPPE